MQRIDAYNDYYSFYEGELLDLTRHMAGEGDVKAAIEILKITEEKHADSWNAYDTLAEIYVSDGNQEMAVKNNQQSLVLNPENKQEFKLKKNGYLKFPNRKHKIVIDTENQVAQELLKHLPIISEAQNIGGEIYFRANGIDIEYDGTETDEFNIGDVVYWRSPDGEKIFSIATLYGNTKFSDWKSPRTFSPCVKIGEIVENINTLQSIQSGVKVRFTLE